MKTLLHSFIYSTFNLAANYPYRRRGGGWRGGASVLFPLCRTRPCPPPPHSSPLSCDIANCFPPDNLFPFSPFPPSHPQQQLIVYSYYFYLISLWGLNVPELINHEENRIIQELIFFHQMINFFFLIRELKCSHGHSQPLLIKKKKNTDCSQSGLRGCD